MASMRELDVGILSISVLCFSVFIVAAELLAIHCNLAVLCGARDGSVVTATDVCKDFKPNL